MEEKSVQLEDHYEPVVLNSSGVPLYGKSESDYIKFYRRVETDTAEKKKRGRLMPFLFLMVLFLMVTVVVVLSALSYFEITLKSGQEVTCQETCSINLVESLPANLTFANSSVSHTLTYDAWKALIQGAEESIHIASFYWTLRGSDVSVSDPSSWQGEDIYECLLKAGTEDGIQIQVVQNQPSASMPSQDTIDLSNARAIEVRSLDFSRLIGAGILHTKFLVVDRKHFYLGSANMDWRSLTQVKELGAVVSNCSCMAEDLLKIFDAYWEMGVPGATIPTTWPEKYDTNYNVKDPAKLTFNGSPVYTYISSSPPQFCPPTRTTDIDSILHAMSTADGFLDIAVMDYAPAIIYEDPKRYWSVIDDKLRELAYNSPPTRVRLLFSLWNHTQPEMISFLQSLALLDGLGEGRLEVKLFQVPSTEEQAKIPAARVNHNKYMVNNNTAYIGTSNWSGDYFVSTGGVGFIITPYGNDQDQEDVRKQLQDVFDRDWNSVYSHPLEDFL